ncbi:MAG: hypothetical protein GY754_40600 [bacterium]|nr:hypothetical protein [bacterium]
MPIKSNQLIYTFSQVGKAIAIIFAGSMLAHIAVMLLGVYFVQTPLYLNFETNFISNLFSISMIPLIGIYSIFSLTILFLWQRLKKATLKSHQREVESEKERVMLEATQNIAALIGEHIAKHNSEIIKWTEIQKRKGKQVSEKVEYSSKCVAAVLESLSEIAFLSPYIDLQPKNIEDIEKMILNKLESIPEYHDAKFINKGREETPTVTSINKTGDIGNTSQTVLCRAI